MKAAPFKIQWTGSILVGQQIVRTKLVECPVAERAPFLNKVLQRGMAQSSWSGVWSLVGMKWIMGACTNMAPLGSVAAKDILVRSKHAPSMTRPSMQQPVSGLVVRLAESMPLNSKLKESLSIGIFSSLEWSCKTDVRNPYGKKKALSLQLTGRLPDLYHYLKKSTLSKKSVYQSSRGFREGQAWSFQSWGTSFFKNEWNMLSRPSFMTASPLIALRSISSEFCMFSMRLLNLSTSQTTQTSRGSLKLVILGFFSPSLRIASGYFFFNLLINSVTLPSLLGCCSSSPSSPVSPYCWSEVVLVLSPG